MVSVIHAHKIILMSIVFLLLVPTFNYCYKPSMLGIHLKITQYDN